MAFGSDGTFNDVVNADYKSGVVTVGTTEVVAAAVGGTNLEDRQELIIYNKSTSTIYFGPTGS
jgi:diacylglycerol kinase family enzyme